MIHHTESKITGKKDKEEMVEKEPIKLLQQDLPSYAERVLMDCNQLPGGKWTVWKPKESTNQDTIANGDLQVK